jgi:hypothetical protein
VIIPQKVEEYLKAEYMQQCIVSNFGIVGYNQDGKGTIHYALTILIPNFSCGHDTSCPLYITILFAFWVVITLLGNICIINIYVGNPTVNFYIHLKF